MEVKMQVLAIESQPDRKNYQGTGMVRSKALQCFIDGKVAVHTLRVDINDDNQNALKELDEMQAGFYMASLTPRAGNYGRLEFSIGKLKAVADKPQAKAA